MVRLQQYVTLYEKDWRNVSLLWKYAQILIYFLTGACATDAYFCWDRLNSMFLNKCILYAELKFDKNRTGRNVSHLNLVETKFGMETFCSFCEYVPVCTVLFTAVWLVFFLMCGRGGRSEHGIPHPWMIVYPAMLFSLVFFIFSVLAHIWLTEGLQALCSNFMRINNRMSCDDLRKFTMPLGNGEEVLFFMLFAKLGTLGMLFGWGLAATVLVFRCSFLIDFTVVKVTIWSGKAGSVDTESGEVVKRLSDDDLDPFLFSRKQEGRKLRNKKDDISGQ